MKLYIFMFSYLLQYCIILSKTIAQTSEEKMITDYILTMNQRPYVNALLCWNKDEIFQLAKLFSALSISGSFANDVNDIKSSINDNDHNVLILLDLNCIMATDFLQYAQDEHLFVTPFHWLMLRHRQENVPQNSHFDWIRHEFKNYDILPDNDITISFRDAENHFTLSQFYKKNKTDVISFENYGKWTKNKLIDERTEKIIAHRRRNLSGIPLVASLVITDNDTLNHMTDRIDSHVDSVTKTTYIFTLILSEVINISLGVIYTDKWGWQDADGRWSGMVGHIQNGDAELAGTAIFVNNDRLEMLDFLTASTRDNVKFVFKQPPLSSVSNLFLLPFSHNVWIASAVLFLVICILLRINATWDIKILHEEKNSQTMDPNWSDACTFTIGAAFQQGSDLELQTISGRVTMIFSLMAMMFLFTSYSANIVALLQSTTNSITTLEDLIHSRLKFGVEDKIYNRQYFGAQTEPMKKHFYETKINPPGGKSSFMSMEEGVQKIREGLFAFHMQAGVGYKLMEETYYEHEKCNLQEIAFLQFFQPHYALRKNSPYKEIVKLVMFRLYECGHFVRENILSITGKPSCLTKEGTFLSVGLDDCYPAMLWFSYGALCSIMVFTIEWLIFYKQLRSVEALEPQEEVEEDDG